MQKYGTEDTFDVDSRHPLNIDRQSLAFILPQSSVLDIGCATGFMGAYLQKTKKCKVTGVDIRDDELSEAKKQLHKVIKGNIEDFSTLSKLHEKYDVILMSAVLEHLANPQQVLEHIKPLLKPDGFIVASTPNIAHWSTRLMLLKGKFEYEEYGIMDNTHLRFFTIKSFKQLFENAGYDVQHFGIDAVGGGYARICEPLSRFIPGLFAYQMVIKATPKK